MNAAITLLESETRALVEALGGRDPAAIMAATERLAVAAVAVRNLEVRAEDPERLTDHIASAQRHLEAAAIKVNMLSHWSRQRIDTLRELRQAPARCY